MKLTAKITASSIRTLALPAGVDDDVFWDGELASFGLRMRRGGARAWVVKYEIAGRSRRMQFGTLAQLDPGKARAVAKDLLAKVRLGQDPARDKATNRTRAGETFGALLPRFLERQRQRLKPRSYTETERHLLVHAKSLHAMPVEDLNRRMIATRLAEIAETSGPAAANRVRGSMSAFCTWLAREGYTEANVVLYTNKQVERGPRQRLLTDDEIRIIWNALDDDQYGVLLKLLLLTLARREELGALAWSEVDLDQALVILPPARTKSRREHLIILSEPARALLASQPRRLDDGVPRDLVFGRAPGRGFADWSGSKAALVTRIAATGVELAPWTVHDFRRYGSTGLHERLAVQPAVIEHVLGHVGDRRDVANIYNKSTYIAERRRALERWAAHVMAVVTGQPAEARVVTLRGHVKPDA